MNEMMSSLLLGYKLSSLLQLLFGGLPLLLNLLFLLVFLILLFLFLPIQLLVLLILSFVFQSLFSLVALG